MNTEGCQLEYYMLFLCRVVRYPAGLAFLHKHTHDWYSTQNLWFENEILDGDC